MVIQLTTFRPDVVPPPWLTGVITIIVREGGGMEVEDMEVEGMEGMEVGVVMVDAEEEDMILTTIEVEEVALEDFLTDQRMEDMKVTVVTVITITEVTTRDEEDQRVRGPGDLRDQ